MSYLKEMAATKMYTNGPARLREDSSRCGEYPTNVKSFNQPSGEKKLFSNQKEEKMTQELALRSDDFAVVEQVVMNGDLGKLTPEQRVMYYKRVCESAGLNPLTKPLAYIILNGKLTLYATKDCTEQLRKINGVSIEGLEGRLIDDIYVVTAQARDKVGRKDESTGAVVIGHLKGEAKANALMKAETKAKRRVTLSLCGMGWTDESEIDSIPNAKPIDVDLSTGEIKNSPPQISNKTYPKITTEQAQDIYNLLGDCAPDYKKWFLDRLKSTYNLDTVFDIPVNMFEKTRASVMKAMEQNHERQRLESQPELIAEVQ